MGENNDLCIAIIWFIICYFTNLIPLSVSPDGVAICSLKASFALGLTVST